MNGKSAMTRIYLQRMVEDVPDDRLPAVWADFDRSTFSREKMLWDYQQQALKNALKALWKYYEDFGDYQPQEADDADRQRKKKFWRWYQDNGLQEDFSIEPKSAFASLLSEYYSDYLDGRRRISYEAFINRMGFWMATGSGKTLVIVKLIELLGRLIRAGEVPPCDILFLTHRDDLIEQLKRHVTEFNASHGSLPIILHDLKEYNAVKYERPLLFREYGITVFYYRSDNLGDEQKEKIVDFRNYDNGGRWFILLDEAHKGDREESKRQHIYSILSRDGFLFNFSATFTDPRDIATTVYNFNLSEYIRRGYGKHLLVLQQELCAFKDKSEDYSGEEKRKVVLKTLLLLAYVRKVYEEKVKPAGNGVYHRPLMLVLVNSVNTEDADLELFFRELEQIARQGVDPALWNAAKSELGQALGQLPTFLFEEDEKVKVDPCIWASLSSNDLYRYVFNATSCGEIEVLVRPSNRQEMAFKLKTAGRPFALVKIGDISAWLKEKLSGYEIAERFDDESLFACLNADDSDINILMGSRSFYEGWDSNRPNVICYINIGTGTDARKFILQSVGRGVRIEPVKNKRRRLLPLYNAKEIEEGLFKELKDVVQPLETLFIFGTNRQALQTVIENLKQERIATGERQLSLFEVNPEVNKKPLLIPVYKPAGTPLVRQGLIARFEVEPEEFQALQSFIQGADDRVLLALTDATPRQVQLLREVINRDDTFDFKGSRYGDLRRLLQRVMQYLSVTPEETDGLKTLGDEIRHFKHITVSLEDIGGLEEKVRRVRDYPTQVEVRAPYGKVSPEEYERRSREISHAEEFTHDGKRITIKHIARHYYLPVVLSEDGKADYIRHIIKTPSEVTFIKDLEGYLSRRDNRFQEFDWWFFSKLDESLDEVYIPYYDPKSNRMARFKPDFIFWLCKGDRYWIVFADPKGTEHVDYQRKIDGYRWIFLQQDGRPRTFSWNDNKTVTVHLFFYTGNLKAVSESYQEFWFDKVEKLPERISGASPNGWDGVTSDEPRVTGDG